MFDIRYMASEISGSLLKFPMASGADLLVYDVCQQNPVLIR